MINTIFYFPNKDEITFKDYLTRSNKDYSGDDKINGRTIVFDPTQGEIWKNGQKYSYGKTTIEEWVNGWILSYLEQAGITAIDLSQYAKTTWVNEQNFVKRSQIGNVFTDATYADGKLKFTRFGGTYSQVEIGRGDVTLKQPLSGINSANLGTPSNGQGLVYDNGSWQYRSYGSGGATYTHGTGINISNNEISLKPASANEIGGIKISSIEDISKPNRSYEVKTTSDGKAYVYVDWESAVYSGEYIINVNPSYIPVQVSSDGKGNLGEVLCAVDVRYNNTSVVGTLANPVIIRNGEEISSNTAIESGISASISGSNIKVKLTNVADFDNDSLIIKSTVSYGGSNVGVAVVTLVGTVKAPASGADAVLLQTSADIVNIDSQHTVASPSAISAKLQIGTNVYTTGSDIAAQGYRIFYKYRNDSQWTLLNGDITINPQKYAESLLIELRKGSSDEYANTQLFAAKEIPFIVDPSPAIGLTLYKINVLSTTIKHKDGTDYFGGTLSFLVMLDDAPILIPSGITLNVLVGGYNADAAVTYDNSTSTYSTGVTEHSLEYNANYPYTLITLKSGQNYVLDSVIIPFIMEGADGSSSQQVQSIQGTVMRVLNYNSAESVCERTPWYTGDTPDTTHNVRFMDILHYTLNNKDYGYFVKKGTSGSVSHAPVEIIDGVEKINYSVNYQDVSGETYISGGSEWEQFQPMSEAVFNALLAKSAYIENLTVAKDLVITDGERNPTAGMTGTSSTINTANGGTVTTGQGDIRIWAGYPTNNNLYNCPFYVTNTGELHATNVVISGTMLDMASPVYTYSNSNGLSVVNGTKWAFVITPETVNGRTHDKVWRVVNWDKLETSTATLVDEEGNTTTKSGDQLTGRQYLEMPAGSGYIILTSTAMGNTLDNPIKILPPAKFCKGKEITISYCSYPRYDLYSEEELIANSYKVDGTYAGSYAGGDICWTFLYNGDYDSLNDYVLLYPGDVVKLVSDGTKWIAIAKFSTYIDYTSHSVEYT